MTEPPSTTDRAAHWLHSHLTDHGAQAKVGVAVLSVMLLGFVVALSFTRDAGAFAGAFGSVVGGLIGAGGAVWAVYLAMSRQRDEEVAKVAAAIRAEVLYLTKYVIGGIEICVAISQGKAALPRLDAKTISNNFAFEPVVYPAVADRVGLLPHPQATVGFYMRIAEAKSVAALLATPPLASSFVNQSGPPQMVSAENASAIADCLSTALQHAHSILTDDSNPDYRTQLDVESRQATLQMIATSLAEATATFPNAMSFVRP